MEKTLMSAIVISPSICRLCHVGCPIEVTLEDGEPVKVTGNKHSPTYFSFCCSRGQAAPEHHKNPERLLSSQKRMPDGSFRPISVTQAMDEIAAKLKAILEAHGPRSVAFYFGTYSGPYPGVAPMASSLAVAIGTPMMFSGMTIDQPGKEVANALLGRWLAGGQPFTDSEVLLTIGSNPLVSYGGGGVPFQNPGRRLSDALKNGMKLIVIDPRRTETASRADIHLQPRPGEDAALLAAIIHVILSEGLYDREFVAENVSGLEALREAVRELTPDYAAKRCDVPAAQIVAAARLFATRRGNAAGSTGVNMSGRSTLNEYLLAVLNTICGRWLREGEALANPGVLLPRALPKAQAEPPKPARGVGEPLRVRNLTQSPCGMPTAALADEILLEGEGRVRALFSVGGNPVSSWPDQTRTAQAMKKLDLMVQLDIKMSSTAKMADYVIAPKTSLEVPGLSLPNESIELITSLWGLPEPFGMYAPKLMDPPAGSDLIDDWEFYFGLAQRLGLQLILHPRPAIAGPPRETVEPLALDMSKMPTTEELFEFITRGSRVPLSEVKKHPNGALFPETITVAPKDADCTARLEVGNGEMMAELAEMLGEPIVALRQVDTHPYLLVCRRVSHSYNSSGRDIPSLIRKGGGRYNPAFMNPADLQALGLKSGDMVEIESGAGRIAGIVEPDTTLRTGVVSMAHGFGDAPIGNPNVRHDGSSTGVLASVEDDYDKYSGIPRMSAIPVRIRPLL